MVDTTNSVQNSQDNLGDLIRQAEIMQLKLKLEVQFKKNMEFLKKVSDKLYNRFIHYTPERQNITIDKHGQPNIINMASKNLVFDTNAEQFAIDQARQVMVSPTRITIGFADTEIVNPRFIHPILCNKALDEYSQLNIKNTYDPNQAIGLMIVIGCGLGYQIKELIKNHDIRNMIIYDSRNDSFYASLFTIDWEEIANEFNQKGGKIKIHVGESHFETLTSLRHLSGEIGLYNMITTHVYKHTTSEDNELFFEKLKKDFHLYGTALGFFDDEQVSFAHTIINMNKNLPFFTPEKIANSEKLPPALIIGNGPSLDKMADFIKEHQDSAVIFSCGSSLPSLAKIGITPDFHVELERNHTVSEMLKLGAGIEYTKDIPLLALNNVASSVSELFKSCHLAIKPNDIGSALLKKNTKNHQHFELPLCNPTVTNCGFSFAVHLGFEEIYLLGTDLGMKSESQHHSKYSIWHDLDVDKAKNQEDHKDIIEDYTYSKRRYPIKGNFCETVMTHNVLDSSRRNMEILIDSNPQLKVFNPNDGAYILGAKPIRLEDIELQKESIDKDKLKESLLSQKFTQFNFTETTLDDVHNKHTKLFFKAVESLFLPEKCDNFTDLLGHFDRIFKNLRILEKGDETTSMIVKGSIQVQLGMLYYFCSRAQKREKFKAAYNIGKTCYHELLNGIIKTLKEAPLQVDDTMLFKE